MMNVEMLSNTPATNGDGATESGRKLRRGNSNTANVPAAESQTGARIKKSTTTSGFKIILPSPHTSPVIAVNGTLAGENVNSTNAPATEGTVAKQAGTRSNATAGPTIRAFVSGNGTGLPTRRSARNLSKTNANGPPPPSPAPSIPSPESAPASVESVVETAVEPVECCNVSTVPSTEEQDEQAPIAQGIKRKRRKSNAPIKAIDAAIPGIIFRLSPSNVDVIKKPKDYPVYSISVVKAKVSPIAEETAVEQETEESKEQKSVSTDLLSLNARRLHRKFFGPSPSAYKMDIDPIEGFPTSELFYSSFASADSASSRASTIRPTSTLLEGWRGYTRPRQSSICSTYTDPALIQDLEYYDEESEDDGYIGGSAAGGEYDTYGSITGGKTKKKKKPTSFKRVRARSRASGEKQCYSCKTTATPIWREVKDAWGDGWEDVMLCNACGLQWRMSGLRCTDCNYVPRASEKRSKVCTHCNVGRWYRRG